MKKKNTYITQKYNITIISTKAAQIRNGNVNDEEENERKIVPRIA